ncbi:hypothetical protein BH11ARM2_BH11ARM2_32590 [soil metagenome]
MKRFPCGQYGRQRLQFHPAPFRAPFRAFAGLVFPWVEDRVVVCDIVDRGWCVPSGRVELNETSLEAIHREALEEAGATLCLTQYIGCYHVSERQEIRWVDCYTARVESLGEIGMKEESRAVRLCLLEELPEMYHLWNDLTKMVFEHAWEIIERRRCL